MYTRVILYSLFTNFYFLVTSYFWLEKQSIKIVTQTFLISNLLKLYIFCCRNDLGIYQDTSIYNLLTIYSILYSYTNKKKEINLK